MSHYICLGGCRGISETPGVCQAGDCPRHGKPLLECDCVNGAHQGYLGIPKWKEVVKFLAGFEAAHLLGHVLLQFGAILPLEFGLGSIDINFTEGLNVAAIIVNTLILVVLVYFGYRKK